MQTESDLMKKNVFLVVKNIEKSFEDISREESIESAFNYLKNIAICCSNLYLSLTTETYKFIDKKIIVNDFINEINENNK